MTSIVKFQSFTKMKVKVISTSYVYNYNHTVILDEKDHHLSDVDVVSTDNPNSGKITTKLTLVLFVLS